MNIYEMYGRQAETIERLREYFRLTQGVLGDLKAGNVQPSQLVVTDQGWEVGDEPERAEPAGDSGGGVDGGTGDTPDKRRNRSSRRS